MLILESLNGIESYVLVSLSAEEKSLLLHSAVRPGSMFLPFHDGIPFPAVNALLSDRVKDWI